MTDTVPHDDDVGLNVVRCQADILGTLCQWSSEALKHTMGGARLSISIDLNEILANQKYRMKMPHQALTCDNPVALCLPL